MPPRKRSLSAGQVTSRYHPDNFLADFSSLVIGQDHALEQIVPAITMFHAGLSPEGRPAGIFLLAGMTGVGKTETVQALAQLLHGSHRNVLRIDCAEYQLDHEVAKLVGAPPGYLGHRETQPLLTQMRLSNVASQLSPLSIILFDEVEKAAPSLTRLLLGVFDKGSLRLGDNTNVTFENTIIFMTSNLGAESMQKFLGDSFGFAVPADSPDASEKDKKFDGIISGATKKEFSPEFINRIDKVLAYRPLTREHVSDILDLQLEGLQKHINSRLGIRGFVLDVEDSAREHLIAAGYSPRFGARELKRVINCEVLQELSKFIVLGKISPGVTVTVRRGKNQLEFLQKARKAD